MKNYILFIVFENSFTYYTIPKTTPCKHTSEYKYYLKYRIYIFLLEVLCFSQTSYVPFRAHLWPLYMYMFGSIFSFIYYIKKYLCAGKFYLFFKSYTSPKSNQNGTMFPVHVSWITLNIYITLIVYPREINLS